MKSYKSIHADIKRYIRLLNFLDKDGRKQI